MTRKAEKCIIALSGGPDSSTVAYWAKHRGFDVYGMSFKYGQIAAKETKCAELTARKLGIPLKTIDLSSLREIFAGTTSLCDRSINMTADFSQTIIVPFRNAIFLSIAVAYASSINALKIFYGAHLSDQPFYPDCRKEFYKAFETSARLGTGRAISIEAPFGDLPKSEIIKQGDQLGVPFGLTWSCYLDGSKHCGKCESCINRRNAFLEARVPDPVEYE